MSAHGTLLTNACGAECPQQVKADAAPTRHSAPFSALTRRIAAWNFGSALHVLAHGTGLTAPEAGAEKRLPSYRNCLCAGALVHYAGCEQKGTAPSLAPTKDAPQKADIGFQRHVCRDGPGAEILSAARNDENRWQAHPIRVSFSTSRGPFARCT
jgi:hypothetical protein